MKLKLASILLWMVAKLLGYNPEAERLKYAKSKFIIPDAVQSILPLAISLCRRELDSNGSSGWKRTAVMLALTKTGAKQKDAALAIEIAVRQMK